MKIEKRGNYVMIVEEVQSLPDFPLIERVIPVMTKKVFQECFKEWIENTPKGEGE